MEFILIIFFVLAIFVSYFLGRLLRQKDIKKIREDAIKRSRAVLTGNFSEQISPYLPGFKYSPTECKFLGNPVDFVVFKGLDQKQISEVVFLEVKSGKSSLNKSERSLKKAIEGKKVSFDEFRV